MYVGNDSYGHREILARAAGLRSDVPLNGVLQHGWTQRALVDLPLPGIGRPHVFGWSESCSERSQEYGLRATANIGAPILYLLADPFERKRFTPPRRTGTLIIPPHSTRLTNSDFDIPLWVTEQKQKYSHLGEITIMLHPADARKVDLKAALQSLDVDLWTNPASMKSIDFIRELIWILSSHRMVVASNLQTAVFYAAYLGSRIDLDVQPQGFFSRSGEFVPDRTPELIREIGISDGRAWKDVCAEQLGLASRREPEELRDILYWNSRSKRFYCHVAGLPNRLRSTTLALKKA